MKYIFFIAILFVVITCPSWAQAQQNITIDMAKQSVDVTTGFSGSDITVFGVVDDQDGKSVKDPAIVVLLKGPDNNVVVRKKEQVAGMWINSDFIEFKNIPHFYDYAISMNEKDIGTTQTLIENGIGLNTMVFSPEDSDDKEDLTRFREFQEALIRIWQRGGNFPLSARQIKLLGNGLFRADFSLPANIPTGKYQVETFLFSQGKLVDKKEKILNVEQAGFSALINRYAHRHSLLYALIGILMAVGMGIFSANLSRKGR